MVGACEQSPKKTPFTLHSIRRHMADHEWRQTEHRRYCEYGGPRERVCVDADPACAQQMRKRERDEEVEEDLGHVQQRGASRTEDECLLHPVESMQPAARS